MPETLEKSLGESEEVSLTTKISRLLCIGVRWPWLLDCQAEGGAGQGLATVAQARGGDVAMGERAGDLSCALTFISNEKTNHG